MVQDDLRVDVEGCAPIMEHRPKKALTDKCKLAIGPREMCTHYLVINVPNMARILIRAPDIRNLLGHKRMIKDNRSFQRFNNIIADRGKGKSSNRGSARVIKVIGAH